MKIKENQQKSTTNLLKSTKINKNRQQSTKISENQLKSCKNLLKSTNIDQNQQKSMKTN